MTTLTIELPEWLEQLAAQFRGRLDDDTGRMAFCIALAAANVEHGGGPFGAAVFSGDELIGVGVNRVVATGFAIAHAEVLALMDAEQRLHSGRATRRAPYCLIASTEPCCQCFGALIWSGVTRLVCGATTEDAEAIGFDEGPKPEAWPEVLAARGIAVQRGVLRAEARQGLEDYRRRGGTIYGSSGAR